MRSTDLCSVPGCSHPRIAGDGPGTPCHCCLLRFGMAAAKPELLSDGEALMLLEAHGDAVELHSTEDGSQHWHWLLT